MAEKRRQSDSLAYITPRSGGQSDPWTEESKQRGGQRLAEVGEVIPPEPVADALRLSPGEKAAVRRRVILLDDEPIAVSYTHLTLPTN